LGRVAPTNIYSRASSPALTENLSVLLSIILTNITKTITIESINIILENQIFKKAEFNLKKSNLVVEKQKVQQLFVKYVTDN
jgi:hypothetical protein